MNFFTIIIYVLTIILTLFVLKLYDKKIVIGEKVLHDSNVNDFLFSVILALPLVLLLGLRYDVGTDYENYEIIFNNIISGRSISIESGFKTIIRIIGLIGGNYGSFIWVTSFITIMLYVSFILKFSENENIDILLFATCTLYLGVWCNTIRQAIAMGIMCFAYLQIISRNLKKFLILVFLAFLFHRSVVFVFPCFFLMGKKGESLRQRFVKIALIAGIIFIVGYFADFGYDSILGIYSKYAENMSTSGISKNYLILYSGFYIIDFIFAKKIIEKNYDNIFFYYLILMEIIAFVLGNNISYAFRMGQYFTISHILLIPSVISCIEKRNRWIIKTIYIFYLSILFYVTNFYLQYNGIAQYTIR